MNYLEKAYFIAHKALEIWRKSMYLVHEYEQQDKEEEIPYKLQQLRKNILTEVYDKWRQDALLFYQIDAEKKESSWWQSTDWTVAINQWWETIQ